MSHTTPRRRRRAAAVALLAVGALGTLSACGGGSDASADPTQPQGVGEGDGSAEDLDAALEEGGELTYWTWTPSAEAQVAAFEEEYPNVDVELVNAGTGNDHYTKLQNAVKAGSGAPDVAQIEYKVLPQFALPGNLVDLSQYGLEDLEADYTPSTWGAVHVGEGLYGLPQDSGPMALFYNKRVFDTFGIEVPETWDDFVQAARDIHKADPDVYLINDPGDSGFTTSMIWQAGGKPFQTDGTDVTIDLADEGAQKWAEVWDPMIEEGLLGQVPGWTDEWFKGLSEGTIATVPYGAWMPGVLESSASAASGDWRVAPMPTYDGTPVNAENGGSTQSVLEQSDNPALAAAFVRWLNNGNGVKPFLESGGFPATVADLNDPEFLGYESEYFGGQKINEVLVEGANSVVEGWQYLPFQLYADSIYADTVGQSYAEGTSLEPGLQAWQDALVEYGDQQGFTVN